VVCLRPTLRQDAHGAAISVHIGAIEKHKLAPGEVGYVLLLAASRSQANIAFQYVTGFLQSSAILCQQVESMTADEVRLKGNVVIGVHAGSYRTIRGRSLLAVAGDETSFWRDIDSAQPDVEIFRAPVRPRSPPRAVSGSASAPAIEGLACCTRSAATTSASMATMCWSCRAPPRHSTPASTLA